MDKKEIQEKLKHSLEVETLNATTLLYSAVAAISSFLLYLRYIHTDLGPGPVFLTIGILLVPVCLYHGWVLWRIYRKAESYRFYRVTLTQPKGGIWRDTMCFQVLLRTEEGAVLTKTRSIFLTHGFGGPLLQDYINCDVTIAYNNKTEQIVVIG